LLDTVLSGGNKSGYLFAAVGANAVNNINTTYSAAASPVTFNQSGVRDFCSNEDGVLRFGPGAAGNAPANFTTTATCAALTVLQ
jgi:hypothetical protein